MSEYVPTTDEVRERYVDTGWGPDGMLGWPNDPEEFDRWLADHDAGVWDECFNAMVKWHEPTSTELMYWPDNPYRAATKRAMP